MIKVIRGLEPKELSTLRQSELERLRLLGRTPGRDDIGGYRIVAGELWRAQYFKCCYCEQKIPMKFNDVEHYRPKLEAIRLPGCTMTHGYWWLAFTWENLLFACPACNRSGKNSKFPLEVGSITLQAEEVAHGEERPLLLDPGSDINPMEHIRFVLKSSRMSRGVLQWWAEPRNGSQNGSWTIEVCDLNNLELRELRGDHVDRCIRPQVQAIDNRIAAGEYALAQYEFARSLALIDPKSPYSALSYDALSFLLPNDMLRPIKRGWPEIAELVR